MSKRHEIKNGRGASKSRCPVCKRVIKKFGDGKPKCPRGDQ